MKKTVTPANVRGSVGFALLCTMFAIGSNLPLRWALKKLADALLDEA